VRKNLARSRDDDAIHRRRMTQFMHLSCWYEDQEESAAMWAIYAGADRRGVALKTTFGRLEQALPSEYEHFIYCGRVHYIDYRSEYVRSDNTFGPFLTKRRSFEHEREVRALIDVSTLENVHPSYRHPPTVDGLRVPVDVQILIERIHVAPVADDWFYGLVRRITERYGVSVGVGRSELDAGPVY
jgi:hypothetical protein